MSETKTNNKEQANQKGKIANVLIVDDDCGLIRTILEVLARKGIRGIVTNNKKDAFDLFDKDNYDLVFTADKISPRSNETSNLKSSFELLEKIKTNAPEMPVIMISKDEVTHHPGSVETAVKAIRTGCCDFLTRPVEQPKIKKIMDTFLPNHNVSTIASSDEDIHTLYQIVGRSTKMSQTVGLAKKIAPTSIPILINGESGTGKELISYLIYYHSKRSHAPYIKVNCAALSDALLESELFGHEKGAFTGAYAQRKGRFEMAHGGTLLLDEITETPLNFQAKLLRVIEQQDFERVGGNENIKVNVRIISTSNKDLLGEVEAGRFRRDLYYRLSGARLLISPLRERPEDLPELVWHFINLYAHQANRHITQLDASMMNIFASYHWPGNVRQLRNVVLISLILGSGQTLSLADVSWLFDELQPLTQKIENADSLSERELQDIITNGRINLSGQSLKKIEQQAILNTLHQTSGNQSKAAKVLGISDRTLREKLRQYRNQDSLQLA